jgi:transcriptional regulator with XRE-family HTH domain
MSMSQLGHALRCLRVAAEVSQKDCAHALGITANYLSLVERGHRAPSLNFLRNFGAHLRVPLRELLWIALADDAAPPPAKETP